MKNSTILKLAVKNYVPILKNAGKYCPKIWDRIFPTRVFSGRSFPLPSTCKTFKKLLATESCIPQHTVSKGSRSQRYRTALVGSAAGGSPTLEPPGPGTVRLGRDRKRPGQPLGGPRRGRPARGSRTIRCPEAVAKGGQMICDGTQQ